MINMEMVTLKGIVIREYPVGENDKFIRIFTRERGVIEASVKGGRKFLSTKAGASQLFAYSLFSLRYGKGRYYLDSCEIIRLFYKIREDLEKLALADYISEVVAYSAGYNEQKEEVMRLLLNIFYFLDKNTREPRLLKSVFELRFMSEIGMMPDIVCCDNCKKYTDTYMYFDILSTKLFCNECHSSNHSSSMLKINESVLKALRHIVFADFNRLFNFRMSDNNMKTLSDITEKYLLAHMNRGFKTLEFYKSLVNFYE